MVGLLSLLLWPPLTLVVDSYFWRRTTWPEVDNRIFWMILQQTRPNALGMSDPGVEPLEILELEAPPYPCPPCPCPPCRLVK